MNKILFVLIISSCFLLTIAGCSKKSRTTGPRKITIERRIEVFVFDPQDYDLAEEN